MSKLFVLKYEYLILYKCLRKIFKKKLKQLWESLRGVLANVLDFDIVGLVWFALFHGISTFVDYLMPNLFSSKKVLFNP